MQMKSTALDIHYYDAGLKVERIAESQTMLPSINTAGFKDEFDLSAESAAVEYFRTEANGKRFTWLGVYRKSKDFSLGDRSNHAGIGCWLEEKVIVHPEPLLNALYELSGLIAKDGPTHKALLSARNLRNDYLPTYIAELGNLSNIGMKYSSGRLQEPTIIDIRSAPKDAIDDAAIIIAATNLQERAQSNSSRILIRIGELRLPNIVKSLSASSFALEALSAMTVRAITGSIGNVKSTDESLFQNKLEKLQDENARLADQLRIKNFIKEKKSLPTSTPLNNEYVLDEKTLSLIHSLSSPIFQALIVVTGLTALLLLFLVVFM